MPNTNIAAEHGGDTYQFAGASGAPVYVDYWDAAFGLASAGGRNIAYGDDFLGDVLDAGWQTTAASSGTSAVVASAAGGVCRITTAATNNDYVNFARYLVFPANVTLVVEARLALGSTADIAVEFGVSDALTETGGRAFSSHTTPTAVASNALVFGYASADSTASWQALAVNADSAQRAVLTTPTPPVASTYQTLQIALVADGYAIYTINGTVLAVIPDAIAVGTVLTPWVAVKALTAAAKSVDVDYIRVLCAR